MYQFSFEKLDSWQKSRALVRQVYNLTNVFPAIEKHGLVNQMQRAAISVASNLAEGTSRNGIADKKRFIQYSFGSLLELLNQIILSYDLGYIPEQEYLKLRNEISHLANMINKLAKTM